MKRIITHNDLDAIGYLIILKEVVGLDIFNKKEIELSMIQPGQLEEYLSDTIYRSDIYDFIHIGDLEFKKVNGFDTIKSKVLFVDHHPKSVELTKPWSYTRVAGPVKQCAASLIWHKYKGKVKRDTVKYKCICKFIEDVRLWDTWDWVKGENDIPRLLNILSNTMGLEEFMEAVSEYIHTAKNPYDRVGIYADDILRDPIKRVKEFNKWIDKEVLPTRKDVEIEGINFALFDVAESVSELGYELGRRPGEEYDVDAFIFRSGNKLSFRRKNEEVDILRIVRQMGGGGHPGACGVVIDDCESDIFGLVEMTF